MTAGTANSADIVVIGGGVVGAATARALAGRGISVALIEAGSLNPASGSSRGTSRIIAPAAYPDRSYLDAGLRAMEGWRLLEAESGERLIDLDGGALYAGSAIEEFAATLDDARVRHELLSADTVRGRFRITGLEDSPVLFQPGAGVIRARHAHRALLRSALKHGARVRADERVTQIEPREANVLVTTTLGTWSCDRVVVAAGPWMGELLRPLGIGPALSVSSQTIAYFAVPDGAGDLPALMEFDGDEPYALIDPERGLKAALHRRGPDARPDGDWKVVDTEAVELIAGWVRSRFEGVDATPIETEACLYTNTPDERFVLERHGRIVVGSACSGQGFQFAPDTGVRLARLATGDG
jgi:sarcosine oxidase